MSNESVATCSICLEDLSNSLDNGDVKLTPCLHKFHTQCIDRWNESSSMCPLCKTEFNSVGCEIRFREYEEIQFSYSDEEKKSDGESDGESDDESDYLLDSELLNNNFQHYISSDVKNEIDYEKKYYEFKNSLDEQGFYEYIGEKRLLTIIENIEIMLARNK